MYFFTINILCLFFTYNLCEGLRLVGTNQDEVPTSNETKGLETLLQDQPVAVLVELRKTLLWKLKSSLQGEEISDFPVKRTTLATFDSSGLQDVSVLNDTIEIREAFGGLEPTTLEREIFTPTFRVIGDVLQKNLLEGSVLLVTMSKPSDEEFLDNSMKALLEKKSQLSVLWAGNYPSDEYLLLKDLAERTGGKFECMTNENNSDENLTEHLFPKTEFENLSEQIKFPEEQKDVKDEETPLVSRAADQKLNQKAVVPLIVEVASGTSLEARPGTPTQIQFTVKNNINTPLTVNFRAGYNGISQNVQPPMAHLSPSTTATIIVNLQPIGAAQSVNAVGTLTLTAFSGNLVTTRQALIFLTPQTTTDTYAPKMSHKYEGDCSHYKEPQNCEQGQWSLEATIQDEDSGLLKVLSEPYGLLFQSQFVAGTRSPVTVYYTATCCQPNVIIWGEDIKGNYVKKSFDVFNQNLLAGEIASIVLGILFILFIIIAIIVAVILIKRRNQRNLIIPRPRSGSR